MAKGGNGGGGKPGGGPDGGTQVQWRGSRGDDTISIVDDDVPTGRNVFTISQFLSGSFDARQGSDTLDFSPLTSDGIYLRLSPTSTFSAAQGYPGFLHDYRTAQAGAFVSGSIANFENIVGTQGDDAIIGYFGDIVIVDGGAGDDLLNISGFFGTVVIGGDGADHIMGNGAIAVGGTWDRSFGPQSGDGETDLFIGYATILDFELPDGDFAGDRLVISGLIGSGNAGAIEQIFLLEFEDRLWMDPDGTYREGAVLPTVDGTGALFILAGISAADANVLVLPDISFNIGTTEADFLLTGTANDDWFELPDAGNRVLFEWGGGNDTLLYTDQCNPSDDTLFFEGEVPDSWTHAIVNGIDSWTAEYNGQTLTIVGLDQAGFDDLTMVAIPLE